MLTSTKLLLSIIVLALVYVIFKLRHWVYITKRLNELPGRKGYPLLGNMIDFLGSPEEVFPEIRKYIREHIPYDVCMGWCFLVPLVGIYGPEDMEKFIGGVANSRKAFVYSTLAPWLGDGILLSSGEKWQKRRKMLTPTFHFSILQKFLKIFNKESKRFVEKLKKNTEEVTNISPFVSIYTLNSMCETSMGISLNETEGGEGYRSSVHDFGNIIFKRLSRPWLLFHFIYHFTNAYLKQKLTIKALHNFSRNIIETRKKDMEIDRTEKNRDSGKKRLALLDMLILAQKNGEDIDDEGIQEEVDTFMFEGHDTTAISISFTLMLLANNKHCQDKLYEEIISVFGDDDREPTHTDLQEMKYMERCIKESLRLYPSVPIVARMMDEDMTTRQGYFIPKGCVVAGMIYDMHRRADLYPEPDKFDPDRFLLENMSERHPFAYIPFSAGPRNCIGNEIVDGPAQKASSEDNEVTPIAVPKHEFIQSIKKEIFVELGKEFRNYRKVTINRIRSYHGMYNKFEG